MDPVPGAGAAGTLTADPAGTAPVAVPRQPTHDRIGHAFVAVLVLCGTLLRLRQWWYGRSMWLDELAVAHNIRDRGYGGLLRPLSLNQSAPPAWLWLERLAYDLLGAGDRALRMVPLLFGVGLLVLLALLTTPLMPVPARCAVLALAAFNPWLISYSNQVKQYSSEAFWVTLVVGVGILCAREAGWRRYLAFWCSALGGAVFSIMAIPVTFLTATLVAATLIRRRGSLLRFAAPAPFVLAVAVGVYVRVLRPEQANPELKAYWVHAYPDHPLSDLGATAHWLARTYRGLMVVPFSARWHWLFALLALFAAVVCLRRLGASVLAMLLVPVALGLAAAALSIYPLSDRLALYAVPTCLLVLGWAASPPARPTRLAWGRFAVGVALLGSLLVPQLGTVATATIRPAAAFPLGGGGNLVAYRQAIGYIGAHRSASDLVLGTDALTWYPMSWYGPMLGAAPARYVQVAPAGVACAPTALADLVRGHTVVWIFEMTAWNEGGNATLIRILSHYGTPVIGEFQGARVVRFDLTRPAPPGREAGCVTIRPA